MPEDHAQVFEDKMRWVGYDDSALVRAFPQSLRVVARTWYLMVMPGMTITWDKLKKMFISQYLGKQVRFLRTLSGCVMSSKTDMRL